MKGFVFFVLFLSLCCKALAQQGIKMLVKDRSTGVNLRDSIIITFNDSIKNNAVSDTGGFYFFQLPVGIYSVRVDRINYRSSMINGIMVGQNKKAYLTMEIENMYAIKRKTKKEKIKTKKKRGKK